MTHTHDCTNPDCQYGFWTCVSPETCRTPLSTLCEKCGPAPTNTQQVLEGLLSQALKDREELLKRLLILFDRFACATCVAGVPFRDYCPCGYFGVYELLERLQRQRTEG